MKRWNPLAICLIGMVLESGAIGLSADDVPQSGNTPSSAASRPAEGIDAAKKALDEKRYDDVDPALAGEFAKKTIDPGVLRLSLQAAQASGKAVTANQRVNELLKATGGRDAALLYLGAQTADLIGDVRTAQLRYLAYARQVEAKTAELEAAFEFILRREAYPDEYKKFVRIFGADAHAWRVGQAQLAKLIEATDADRSLDVAGYLIDTFPQPERVDLVHQVVRNAAEAFVFGKEPRDRYLKPLLVLSKRPGHDYRYIEQLFQNSASVTNDEQRVRIVIDMVSSSKFRIPRGVIGQFAGDLRSLKVADLQKKGAMAYLAAGPVYTTVDGSYSTTDRDIHYDYLRGLAESPALFHAKDNPLLDASTLAKQSSDWMARNPEELSRAREMIQWVSQNYLSSDPAARENYLREHLAQLTYQQLSDLASLSHDNNPSALVQKWSAGKPLREVIDARMQLFSEYVAANDKAGLIAATRDYLDSTPTNFNKDHVWQWVFGGTLLDNKEKLALLNEEIDKAGYSPPFKSLLEGMAGNGAWAKDPDFQKLKVSFDQKPIGKDLAEATIIALSAIKQNQSQPDAAVLELARKFVDGYKEKIPASADQCGSIADLLVQQIFEAHATHVYGNPVAVASWAELWAPRLPVGANWERLTGRLREQRQGSVLARLIPLYAAAVKAASPDDVHSVPASNTWRNLMQSTAADGQAAPLLADDYALMGPDLALNYVFGQRTAWESKRQLQSDQIARALSATGGKLTEAPLVRGLLSQQWGLITGGNIKMSAESTRTLWENYLADVEKGGAIDLDLEGRVHSTYISAKHDAEAAAFFSDYAKLLEKRTPEQRLAGLSSICRWSNLPSEQPPYNLQEGHRRYVLLKVMKPLYEQVAPRDFDATPVPGNSYLDIGSAAIATVPTAKDANADAAPLIAEQKKQAMELSRLWLRMIDAGTRFDAPPSYLFAIGQAFCQEALKTGDPVAITQSAREYGEMISRDTITDQTYAERIGPMLKLLDDRGADEASYVFVAAIQHGKPVDSVSRQLMLAKAKAATRIKGLIPVPPADPSYDLYMASASLMGGDEGKAWELTAPKLNLLKSGWEGFDARYVAWSVEQMRKQKVLKDSLEFTFNILLHESDLDAETAGKILLTQSDVYKDLENYQAARIGYEGLKNNNRYAKTEAGQKSVYRLIELHILTRDYTAAETLLERMSDADDVKKQAEAFYLYAEMAFQQGQYKEARDYLKKVKDRVANHVEAALLEGELNLILPGGLANTEVAIGDPRLSTVVIPGRYLTLQLQDPNLSIARGGAAIPVIVTTSKGGDVEHVKLIPSSSNKSLFSARIATSLGHAVQDNLTLELIGDDVVSYVIDPDFQKANDLHYPPKVLQVRDDARLVASSGEILSEEEEEKRELERQLQRRWALESRRLEVARDGRTVRPGSSIYVQVTDGAMDLTDAADAVKIDLHTTSGDTLEGFTLTETGPHTGIFRGAVPTGIPQPRALASDFDEGKEPASVILPGAVGDGWLSLADGRKNKWLEIDTMSSHEVSSVTMEVPHLATVTDVELLGMLADDYETLAALPARVDAAKGGVQIEIAPNHAGDTVDQMRRHLKLAAIETIAQEAPVIIRNSTSMKDKGDVWATLRLRGTFWVSENRSIELGYMQQLEPWSQRCHVLIDGQPILGHFNQQTSQMSSRVDLAKGAHTLEILLDENHASASVVVGIRQPDGSLAALPADWFSVTQHPELLEYLRPKGRISVNGDTLTATFEKPVRLRKVKAVFHDFTGTAVGVKRLAITDAAGKSIVPVPLESIAKGVLAIAPGDQVFATYNDTRRLHGETKVLTSTLNSSYYNGTIALAEEVITANPNNPQERLSEYLPAKRCRAGDQLMVVVTDYDEDTTDNRDTVDVNVTTSSGESLTIKALETYVNHTDEWHNHAGQFLAVLKFGNVTKADTIKVHPGDRITVSYVDRENTKPGIPIERTYTVTEAGAESPRVTVYRTSVKMVPDESPEARARLKRITGRETKGAILYKPLTVARHPDFVLPGPATRPSARKEIVASVDAPLLFDVSYPRRALNSGSVLEVSAVAESELQAAAREKREPVSIKVPTYVEGIDKLALIKGYPVELQSGMRRNADDMLKAGAFSGIIRLQVGSKGDPIDDMVLNGEFLSEAQRLSDPQGLHYKIPTLLVSGSDVVHIRVTDESNGQVVDTPIRLLSDARLDLLDPTYVIATDAIHLGEKFHIRVTDADHDTTNDRDTVLVNAKSSSGSEVTVTLTETLPHSGVFTAALEPQFVRDIPATRPSTQPASTQSSSDPPQLKVDFGDTITFTYVDDLSLESTSPLSVTRPGKILLGSDAEVVSFTKKFKDPEIAVKTRFLMAEALFETAKEHRKIGEMAQADAEISKGKQILDEAIRDYPNTSLASQGEYLLANLAQELTNYQEAVGRYSAVISTWPDSEYAAPSQFKQALCFEKMGKYDQAVEEYVKLTYLYPDSPLVADATIRLGNYYYKNKSYKTASKIFSSFQLHNPTHRLAPNALFLAAQCAYNQGDYKEAADLFAKTADTYQDEKSLRPEAMYWQADSSTKINDNVKAFRTFKKVTWDFPESQWAKAARGRLTEEVFTRMQEQDQQ